VPAALLLAALVALVVADPAAAALSLFAPNVATLAVLLIAAHATWRVASIVNAWRITHGPGGAKRALAVASVLAVTVLVVHLAAGVYVSSVASAGSQIFTAGGNPGTGNNIDNTLGGAPVASPTPGPNGQLPGDCNGDGTVDDNDILLGDTNGDCVVDANDDPQTDTGDDGSAGNGTGGDPGAGAPPPGDPGPVGVLPTSGPINVLFIGFDSGLNRDHALTDSLIVASYFPERGTVTMISIARDMGRMPLYKGGIYKNRINTFMGYAKGNPALFPEGNIAALMKELGYFLGTNIPFYAITNLDNMPKAIDAVGGVDVTLTAPLADPYLGLYLDPGVVHLTGANLIPFVRSRHGPNNSDWQRERRHQSILEALAKKATSPELLANLPTVLDALSSCVRTNIPASQADTLLTILRHANDASTVHMTLASPQYSTRIPPDEVQGRWMVQPVMSGIRQLSLQVFGSFSRYN
jgi:LCP family protein required for cell wall assembly